MNFQKTIKVKTTKEKAYIAVTNEINKWWGNVDTNDITKVGDEFSIFFEKDTEWRFTMTKLDKFDKVSWKCIYANHSYSGMTGTKEEWLNSEVRFEFKDLGQNTIALFFEHNGLTPELNCYEVCKAGWTYFVVNSLKDYLETGKGGPNLVQKNV